MEREAARQYIRENWETILRGITPQAQKKVSGRASYICPFCGHGKGGDGLTINPKGKTGALKCFGCGFSGDVLDVLAKENSCDHNTALKIAADVLGITIDPYNPGGYDLHNLQLDPVQPGAGPAEAREGAEEVPTRQTPTEGAKAPKTGAETAKTADYRGYYKACRKRLDDPAAVSYLQARGIRRETAAACYLGYDPQADPANVPGAMGDEYRPYPCPRIILPTGRGHYVGRSIDPATAKEHRKTNSKGGSPGIFNWFMMKDWERVFVVEGAFDALSIVEVGAAAVALNSKNNGKKLLDALQDQSVKTRQFIICPDNDRDPQTNAATQATARKLCDDLRAAGYISIVYNVAGDHHDANDALIADREGLRQRVKAAEQEIEKQAAADQLPGVLLYDDVVKAFQEADDTAIEIKTFPAFSKAAKIKLHSSVAIAADTGGGKSSLALNFLNDLNSRYPCMYFNLEMDRITVLRRLVAIQGGLELDRIEGYQNDPNTAAAVNAFLKTITDRKPLQVLQDVYMLDQIEAIIEKSTAGRQEPTLVFIDHSLLIEISARVAGRYERFTIISEKLRKISLKYNIIMFVLLQQNRAGKADDDEKPKNSSLKESGSWENDATHICFLWYDPQAKRKKLIMTKNRGGNQGEFILNYWPATQTYTEAKDQPAATASPAGKNITQRQTKREKAQERLQAAYMNAVIATGGRPTLHAIAEAADVTTATVKRWIKEYGGCTVDGETIDPAGIETAVEYTGFIRLNPADVSPFETDPEGNGQEVTARF